MVLDGDSDSRWGFILREAVGRHDVCAALRRARSQGAQVVTGDGGRWRIVQGGMTDDQWEAARVQLGPFRQEIAGMMAAGQGAMAATIAAIAERVAARPAWSAEYLALRQAARDAYDERWRQALADLQAGEGKGTNE